LGNLKYIKHYNRIKGRGARSMDTYKSFLASFIGKKASFSESDGFTIELQYPPDSERYAIIEGVFNDYIEIAFPTITRMSKKYVTFGNISIIKRG
jgi:hypothetical protein